VTGDAGFIGSHLCRRLLDQGHDVLCVDNFYTGTRHNVRELLANPRLTNSCSRIVNQPPKPPSSSRSGSDAWYRRIKQIAARHPDFRRTQAFF
jgi:nucleoside-diphosphate-sugar epimerase